jgi:hypothetical protein
MWANRVGKERTPRKAEVAEVDRRADAVGE